ncbi:MAG: DUF2304 domain-containing protein [Sarcina sp.]
MSNYLQIIMLVASSLFTLYILLMVKKNKLQLSYSILWLATGISFVILSVFPNLLEYISGVLQIETPMNALFLIIIFFLILIIFTLTIVISKLKTQITNVSQALGLLEEEIYKGDLK